VVVDIRNGEDDEQANEVRRRCLDAFPKVLGSLLKTCSTDKSANACTTENGDFSFKMGNYSPCAVWRMSSATGKMCWSV